MQTENLRLSGKNRNRHYYFHSGGNNVDDMNII
jgi:hypothetical protein